MMTLGSLFDGIGGFPLAAVHNGIIPMWASEIETFPIEVTKIRFPNMIHMGDITKLDGAKLPPVDVICGGSPCQDLSVAGNRRGLAGERSGLFMEQVRIVKEMRKADGGRGIPDYLVRPRYLVWENVPGAFSSAEGRDFQVVLEEIIHIKEGSCHVPRPDAGRWEPAGAAVLGNGFSLAWRVLDAQYWGVPQRRRRIYLVADFGGRTAPEILFKQDSLFGNPAAGEGEGQGTAATTQGGADDSSQCCLISWDEQSRRILKEDVIWPDLYGGEGSGYGYLQTSQKTTDSMPCQDSQGNGEMDIILEKIPNQRGGMESQPIAGRIEESNKMKTPSLTIGSFHINQRNEIIDLYGLSGALLATRNIQMQTFVTELPPAYGGVNKENGGKGARVSGCDTFSNGEDGQEMQKDSVCVAAFCSNAGSGTRGIGYQEECSPTLKTGAAPSVLCLNDQGGSQMTLTENRTDTLRAQEHGHQPLVFNNHTQDSRFTGPVPVSQTISACFGTGGNNMPLIKESEESICIAGHIIGRDMKNGGNGMGCQANLSYTLTATDQHAVFSHPRMDEFHVDESNEVTGICRNEEGLICQPYQETVGTISYTDHKGINSQYVSQDKCIIEKKNLIRRLTPLECERLQGFPDGWTDIPGASDSARYKALGNSVAIPCVDFVLYGIAYFLRK